MSPTRWLVLSVTSPSQEDAVSLLTEGLLASGGRAVWEEGGCLVTHVPEPADPEAFREDVAGRLRAWAGSAVEVRTWWQLHEDWAENWKRGLAPRRLTPRIVVTPSWLEPAAGPEDVVITLDPGVAFGTAEHGTTRGCIRLLDRVLAAGARVLDVGTGSGILAIAAARLGAAQVVAFEGDPLACEAARENLVRNDVLDRVELREAWADAGSLRAEGVFDGVTANLESALLEKLLPALRESVRPAGWIITSGVLEGELEALLGAAGALGLSEESLDQDGEWRSTLFRRR